MTDQREIKFRAWDKKHSVMLSGIELSKLLRYLLFQKMPNSDAYEMMQDHFEELIWLEYTGLKDKNGKEIYEGDLFNCIYNSDGCINHILEVYWNEFNTGFCLVTAKGSCQQSGVRQIVEDMTRHEVIGNIYENPELLLGENSPTTKDSK